MKSCFTGENWYKGALHGHTSLSDGHVPPQEMLRRYRGKGYSFAALTDHDWFGHYPEADCEEFVSIPGAEIIFNVSDFKDNIRGTHVVTLAEAPGGEFSALGPAEYAKQVSCDEMNECLRQRRAGGNSMILAHPYWSYMDFADAERVECCFAIEIFNALCRLEANSDGLAYWDYLLRHGKRIYGVAVDDHHNKGGDLGGGWVVIKSNALSREAVFDSLLTGNFYSSTGPEILDFGIDGGKVCLLCKPAATVAFTAFGPDCWPMNSIHPSGPVEYGEYELTGRERYVRAEVTGFDGSRAWTNPIFF